MTVLADGIGFEQYPMGGDRDDDVRLVARSYACGKFTGSGCSWHKCWADIQDEQQDAAMARILEAAGWPADVLTPSQLAYRKSHEVRLSAQMVCVL